MRIEEKMSMLSTLEYFADRIIGAGREENVRFILSKYEAESFEGLSPVHYSEVLDELSLIEAELD